MKQTLVQPVSSLRIARPPHQLNTLRAVTTAAAVALLAMVGLSRAHAAIYTASDQTQLLAAIAAANANPDTDTINLVPKRIYRITTALALNSPNIANGTGATLD